MSDSQNDAYRGLTQNLVERSEIDSKLSEVKEAIRRELEIRFEDLQRQIDSLIERDKEHAKNFSVMIRLAISALITLLVAITGLLTKIVFSSPLF